MRRPVLPVATSDRLLRASEVRERLRVSDETLRAISAHSRFLKPELRPGPGAGDRYFRESDLVRYLEWERPRDQVGHPERDAVLLARYRESRPHRKARGDSASGTSPAARSA